MKNVLLSIFAVPAGFLANVLYILLYEYLIKYLIAPFTAFEFVEKIIFFICYCVASWLIVLTPSMIAPVKKMLFASIAYLINFSTLVYIYYLNPKIDILTITSITGSTAAIIYLYIKEQQKQKKEYEEIKTYLDSFD